MKILNVHKKSILDDCTWSEWSDSSSCSKTCGHGELSGIKKQRRSKLVEEVSGGKCDDIDTRDVACTTDITCPRKKRNDPLQTTWNNNVL